MASSFPGLAKEYIQAKGLHNIGFESGAMTVDGHKKYAQDSISWEGWPRATVRVMSEQ